MGCDRPEDELSIELMRRIIALVVSSGASQTEALAALNAAAAIVPVLEISAVAATSCSDAQESG